MCGWRTHAGTGALFGVAVDGAWLFAHAAVPALPAPSAYHALTLPTLAAYLSAVPDADHHTAKIRYAFPPARWLYLGCRQVAGWIDVRWRHHFRHRGITHWFSTAYVLGVLTWLACAYAAPALVHLVLDLDVNRAMIVVITIVAALMDLVMPPGWLIGIAMTVGCSAHIVGDSLTVEGTEALMPFSRRRLRAGLFATGSRREDGVICEENFAKVQYATGVLLVVLIIYATGGA